MSEIDRWLALLDPTDDDAMMRAFTVVDFDEYSEEDQDTLRHIIRTIRSAARRQAFEEAAKVADGFAGERLARVGRPSAGGPAYDLGRATGYAHIAEAIRALASDALLDRQGNGKEGVQ